MRSVGKQARDESGKHPVNENDEEILRICARSSLLRLRVPIHAILLKRSVVIALAPAQKRKMPGTSPGMSSYPLIASV